MFVNIASADPVYILEMHVLTADENGKDLNLKKEKKSLIFLSTHTTPAVHA